MNPEKIEPLTKGQFVQVFLKIRFNAALITRSKNFFPLLSREDGSVGSTLA